MKYIFLLHDKMNDKHYVFSTYLQALQSIKVTFPESTKGNDFEKFLKDHYTIQELPVLNGVDHL